MPLRVGSLLSSSRTESGVACLRILILVEVVVVEVQETLLR